jgi:hypothetical protein
MHETNINDQSRVTGNLSFEKKSFNKDLSQFIVP